MKMMMILCERQAETQKTRKKGKIRIVSRRRMKKSDWKRKTYFHLFSGHYFKLNILQVKSTLLHMIGESCQTDYCVPSTPSNTSERIILLYCTSKHITQSCYHKIRVTAMSSSANTRHMHGTKNWSGRRTACMIVLNSAVQMKKWRSMPMKCGAL